MESGIPDFEVTVWQGYVMPKGASKAHVAKVLEAMHKALADPALKKRFFDAGVMAAPVSPEEFRRFIDAEYGKWQKVVAVSGAKLD